MGILDLPCVHKIKDEKVLRTEEARYVDQFLNFRLQLLLGAIAEDMTESTSLPGYINAYHKSTI